MKIGTKESTPKKGPLGGCGSFPHWVSTSTFLHMQLIELCSKFDWRLGIQSSSQFTCNRNNQITNKNISSSSTLGGFSQDIILHGARCRRPTQRTKKGLGGIMAVRLIVPKSSCFNSQIGLHFMFFRSESKPGVPLCNLVLPWENATGWGWAHVHPAFHS